MKKYNSHRIKIPYKEATQLHKEGKLLLGITDELSINILSIKALRPKNKSVVIAFYLWFFIGFLGLCYSIYLSFTSEWWIFIVGFICFRILTSCNNKAHIQNILEEAMRDEDFYNNILSINGWLYQITENDAQNYLVENK